MRTRLRAPALVALTLAPLGACAGGPAREVTPPEARASAPARAPASATPRFEHFSLRSARLSEFSGREVRFEATVLTPPDYDPARGWAAHYVVHGFGSSALRTGMGYGGDALDRHAEGVAPPLVRVYLDANHPLGHHVFADSANTGPWGAALVEELLPAIEARYGAIAEPRARFVSGHSSGGWSSLWLQVEYPAVFGGAWSLAPDPVDFRDFCNVDLYRFESMYQGTDGQPIPLVRGDADAAMTLRAFVEHERQDAPPGQRVFDSFDAVFSPRGPDGQPRRLFDRDSGRVDHEVAEAWRRYDIRDKLRREWSARGPLLRGKLHVFVGTEDTYHLEGAVKLLADELAALGSDAEIVLVPGRDHVDLFAPHPELYPRGLLGRVEDEMWASFVGARARE
ncbi:MAG: enterochelin esterase [Myxococcales bacterium]|nr:enterochelin esterase [Myxococcales bacterium]